MPRTPAQNRATYKYNKTHLKRVPLDMQLEEYEKLKEFVTARNESVNGFIKLAISERIERLNREQKHINQSKEENQN